MSGEYGRYAHPKCVSCQRVVRPEHLGYSEITLTGDRRWWHPGCVHPRSAR